MLGLTRLLGRYAEGVHYVLGSVTSTDQAEASFVARVSESHAESAFSVATRPLALPRASSQFADRASPVAPLRQADIAPLRLLAAD